MKQINITVDEDGNLKVDLEGFKGRECDSEKIKAFERELGSVEKKVLKPEYNQPTTTTQQQKV